MRWALGDTVCLSALVRDLALTYPGQYKVMMSGHYQSFWENNPHVAPLDHSQSPKPQLIQLNYQDGINCGGRADGRHYHFLSWFYRSFKEKAGVDVPVLRPQGDIHLSEAEKQPAVAGRYWLVFAGGKLDMTTKWWHQSRYQEVVDRLRQYGVHCVQAGADFHGHVNFALKNCLNLVGATPSIRDLFGLVYHAEGVICPITSAMHIAAAFNKPCVVLAGAREEWWWEAYADTQLKTFGDACAPVKVPHRYLHTMGVFECKTGRGCWTNKTIPLEPADHYPSNKFTLCQAPVCGAAPSAAVPKCLDLITSDHVIEAVMTYYEQKILPPIGTPKGGYPALQPAPPPEAQAPPPEAPPAPAPEAETPTLLRELKGQRPTPPPVPFQPKQDAAYKLLDHPLLGGRVTVFILCYGDHFELAKRCIDSVCAFVPHERLDLRIGLNAVCRQTLEYVSQFPPTLVSKVYDHPENKLKYPLMREMFWDPHHPIRTPYVAWFDDDSYVVDPDWLLRLGECIVANHPHGARLYGIPFHHDLKIYARDGHQPADWFRTSAWYRRKDFHVPRREATAPNGTSILFVSGGFWALATETIAEADIPDRRLRHRGGDITIGEQVHQAGRKTKAFNVGPDGKPKIFVHSSGAPRRGHNEPFPWSGREEPAP